MIKPQTLQTQRNMTKSYPLHVLAEKINASIKGNPNIIISGINTLQDAGPGEIAFLNNRLYAKYLSDTKASAVIAKKEDAARCKTNVIIPNDDDAYFAFAKITQLFNPQEKKAKSGIHPTAIVGKDCKIDASVSIGPYVVIGDLVEIGKNTVIDERCSIGDNTVVGEDCHFFPDVVIAHDVTIHNRVVVDTHTVIGSDGFGFAPHHGKWEKIVQFGRVVIEDDVDIGANTCIDRGAIGNTVIEHDVIIDNQVQIAHNVEIGAHSVLVSHVGIAGSTKIGKRCMLAGKVGVASHLTITDDVILSARATVLSSISKPGQYSSASLHVPHQTWLKNAMTMKKLHELSKELTQLKSWVEKKMGKNV